MVSAILLQYTIDDSYTVKNVVYRNTPGEQYFPVSMVTVLPWKQENIAPLGCSVTRPWPNLSDYAISLRLRGCGG